METDKNTQEAYLQGVLDKAEKDADSLNDEGHSKLTQDLFNVYYRAKIGKYHDFHKNGEDAPKVTLVADLDLLRKNVMNGDYDN